VQLQWKNVTFFKKGQQIPSRSRKYYFGNPFGELMFTKSAKSEMTLVAWSILTKKPLLNRICKAKQTNHDNSIHDSVDGSIIFNRELDQSSYHAETTF
jgi:hypothetical protein